MNRENERSIEEQYANWHPETEEQNSSVEDEPTSELNPDTIREYVRMPEVESSPEAGYRNAARRFYDQYSSRIEEQVKEVGSLLAEGKVNEVADPINNFVTEAKVKSKEFLRDEVNAYFQEFQESKNHADSEAEATKKNKLYKLALEGLNFIPVLGSAKMIGEGLAGRTMSGEKLSKQSRLLHTAEGTVFLALDLTGVGIAAAEGMKSGRLVTRTAALMRKMGMSREVYMSIYKTGRYLLENPGAGKLADLSFEKIIKARKLRKNSLVEKNKDVIFAAAEKDEAEFANAA